MRKLFMAAAVLGLAANYSEAGVFCRRSACAGGTCPTAASPAPAKVQAPTRARAEVVVVELATAQGAANHISRTGIFRHHGGNRGFEGIGMGASEAQAIAACCKPRHGGPPREIGVARMASGLWVAVCRW